MLIVDDERSMLETLALMIEGVDTAATIHEGLAMARRRLYPVVLLDVCFPGSRSGLDAIEAFCATGARVLMMTNDPIVADCTAAFARGASGYIAKYEMDVLLDAVRATRRLAARATRRPSDGLLH